MGEFSAGDKRDRERERERERERKRERVVKKVCQKFWTENDNFVKPELKVFTFCSSGVCFAINVSISPYVVNEKNKRKTLMTVCKKEI